MESMGVSKQLLTAAGAGVICGLGLGILYHRSQKAAIILKHLQQHVSIRKFSDRPVPRCLLNELVEIGVRASTSGNMQTYSVIITTDASSLAELAKIHDNKSMASAKAVLTFCADWSRHIRWCELRKAGPGYDNWMAFITGNNDAMVAAQTVAVAAEAMGLGICFLGSTTWATSKLCNFFSLPAYVHPVTSLQVGWPAEFPACRARLPMGGIVHHERYVALNDSHLMESYRDREIEGWQRYNKLYGSAWVQKCKDQDISNLAQAYTTLKYTGRDFRRWSRLFLGTLEQQGFANNSFRDGDEVPGPHNI